MHLIADTKRMKADIFGFGEYVRALAPKYWKEHVRSNSRWSEQYHSLDIEIHINYKVRRVGMKAK